MINVAIIQKCIPHYRLDFYKELHEQGKALDIRIIVFTSMTAKHACDFPVCMLPVSYPFGEDRAVFWMKGLKKSIQSYDVVVAPQELSGLSILWLLMIRKTLCKSWIWWGHGFHTKVGPDSGTKRRVKESLRNLMTVRGDGIITYTQSGADYWRRRGFDERQAIPYFNTIGVEKLRKVAETISDTEIIALKKKLGVLTKKILLFCGRLIPTKKIGFLLKSFAFLKKRMPDVSLFIMGTGPQRKELEDVTAALNLHDVHFLGEIVDDRESSLYFRMADVFVLPGSVGLNIAHAFTYGLPLVTTEQRHSVEIEYLRDGENGIVTPFDEKLYAREIASLLSSPHRLHDMQNCAWGKGDELFLRASVYRFLEAIRVISQLTGH